MLIEEIPHFFRNIEYNGYNSGYHHHIYNSNNELFGYIEVEYLWFHCLKAGKITALLLFFSPSSFSIHKNRPVLYVRAPGEPAIGTG